MTFLTTFPLDQPWIVISSGFNVIMLIMAGLFLYESWKEEESRAVKFGIAGVLIHAGFLISQAFLPVFQTVSLVYMALFLIAFLLFLLPVSKNTIAAKGTAGYIVGDVNKFDERDIVFARNDSLRPGSEQYEEYYGRHPERKERDDKRRAKGSNLGRLGSIDNSPALIVNMVKGSGSSTGALLRVSRPDAAAEGERLALDPKAAANTVKNWAKSLGADLVGVCEINQNWMYSRKGYVNPSVGMDEWGKEIVRNYTHAVVIATEMDHDVMRSAPHTPVVMETMKNYSKGAFITATMANWFAQSGYEAVANHASFYESLMVPLAIDAGIGEMSRMGYMVSGKYGGRIRLAAVLTNMPLEPDKPVDLGVDDFCKVCKKCAESCPSRSIPLEDKIVQNGTSRWILNAETCHDYWGRVGTDCGVCMIICPFSRPDRSLHKLVKWILKRSMVSRKILPHVDNIVYGRKWKTRRSPDWIPYR